jgi:pimeloyl-ACP methyl ester carboxylesterase
LQTPTAAPTPQWFSAALAAPCEHAWIVSGGTRIHYQTWPAAAALPGVVLIHGHAAHTRWWDCVAPGLSDRHRVCALDLSGAGDSGHRPVYSDDLFAQEVLDVMAHAGLDGRTVLVGHSFGGRVARNVAGRLGSGVGGLVLADSYLGPASGASTGQAPRMRPPRAYASAAEAVRRFRLRPPQPCRNRFLLEHVARHSVAESAGRWHWKLDPLVFRRMPDLAADADPVASLAALACRRAIVYGAQSRFFPQSWVDHLAERLPDVEWRAIPDARHHLFLDQPLAFIQALRELLARWNRPPAGSAG